MWPQSHYLPISLLECESKASRQSVATKPAFFRPKWPCKASSARAFQGQSGHIKQASKLGQSGHKTSNLNTKVARGHRQVIGHPCLQIMSMSGFWSGFVCIFGVWLMSDLLREPMTLGFYRHVESIHVIHVLYICFVSLFCPLSIYLSSVLVDMVILHHNCPSFLP